MVFLVFAGIWAIVGIVGIRRGHMPSTFDRRWSVGEMIDPDARH
jgi:hypothetical protein